MSDQPPNNPQAEQAVLGALMVAGGQHLLDGLTRDHQLGPDDFYTPAHERVFAAIQLAADHGAAIDGVQVTHRLSTNRDHVGDPADIVNECLAEAATMSQAVGHVRLLKDLSQRRVWRNAARHLNEAAEDGDEKLVATAERLLANPGTNDDSVPRDGIGHQLMEWFEDTTAAGISTGFVGLDNMIGGGLRPGDSTAIGAWTGMGKSALVDQILTHASTLGYRCHAYQNEMSIIDRGIRMMARSGVAPYSKLIVRDLEGVDWGDLVKAAGRIPFGITEVAQWDADRIARHIRAHRWDLCVFDHIHNMPYQRTAELDAAIATLCNAARSSGAHLILVCQFNEERAKSELLPMPVMRDIRGTGMLKNQCPTVLLLHRQQEHVGQVVVTTNQAILKADKARHGVPGSSVLLDFDHEFMSFWPQGPRSVAA